MAGERILVVDQHHYTAQLLRDTLEHEGFAVRTATDSASAISIAHTFRPDIVISNATTGCTDNLELVRALQKGASVAMILLTVRDALYSRDELVSRVHALLRRSQAPAAKLQAEATAAAEAALRRPVSSHQPPPRRPQTTVAFGDIELDYGRHDIRIRNVPVRLSRTEFSIVAHLVADPGRVIHYDDLLEAVWGPPYRGERHLLQVHVQRLRLKLAGAGCDRDCIRNRWGIGYVIDIPADHQAPRIAAPVAAQEARLAG